MQYSHCVPAAVKVTVIECVSQSGHNSIAPFWQLYLKFNTTVCHVALSLV